MRAKAAARDWEEDWENCKSLAKVSRASTPPSTRPLRFARRTVLRNLRRRTPRRRRDRERRPCVSPRLKKRRILEVSAFLHTLLRECELPTEPSRSREDVRTTLSPRRRRLCKKSRLCTIWRPIATRARTCRSRCCRDQFLSKSKEQAKRTRRSGRRRRRLRVDEARRDVSAGNRTPRRPRRARRDVRSDLRAKPVLSRTPIRDSRKRATSERFCKLRGVLPTRRRRRRFWDATVSRRLVRRTTPHHFERRGENGRRVEKHRERAFSFLSRPISTEARRRRVARRRRSCLDAGRRLRLARRSLCRRGWASRRRDCARREVGRRRVFGARRWPRRRRTRREPF